jgi:hypothetical protein
LGEPGCQTAANSNGFLIGENQYNCLLLFALVNHIITARKIMGLGFFYRKVENHRMPTLRELCTLTSLLEK